MDFNREFHVILGKMVRIQGITGLVAADPGTFVSPPYDVIQPGSEVEDLLSQRLNSAYPLIRLNENLPGIWEGTDRRGVLDSLVTTGVLKEDETPSYYVLEQEWDGGKRIGVLVSGEVTDYDKGQVIRHEKTFDDKVEGRVDLRKELELQMGPVWCLVRDGQNDFEKLLGEIVRENTPDADFTCDFESAVVSEMHGMRNRVFRIPASSDYGRQLAAKLNPRPFYIADGHHRYHACFSTGQKQFFAYVCPEQSAQILAYNRVINPSRVFEEIKCKLDTSQVDQFKTPEKGHFSIYTKGGIYVVRASDFCAADDVVGKLDVTKLERQVYPHLGLVPDMISLRAYLDYYPETALDRMKGLVDSGAYKMAVALHPVSVRELLDVAYKGFMDGVTVMPEKSTYFYQKLPTGIVMMRI